MRKFLVIAACLLTFTLTCQWIRLPLIHQGIWMSPDETANALAAVNFARHGSFTITYPLVGILDWAVPRSFVGVSSLSGIASHARIAPVGFLGMPLILAIAYKIFGVYGLLFLTALVALATLWPLWASLPKKWNEGAKWSVLLAWVSFPTVIIYANRGAFGNLFLTCLAIWIWWLLTNVKTIWRWPVTGILLGLALMIRPPEAIWLLPVLVFAVLFRPFSVVRPNSLQLSLTQERAPHHPRVGWFGRTLSWVREGRASYAVLFALPLLITLALGTGLGFSTYEKLFVSGYQIRPVQVKEPTGPLSAVSSVSVLETIPMGIHPRNIAWNTWQYIMKLFWPWTSVCLLATIVAVREKIWKKREKWAAAAFAWTTVWLIAFYGNGVYQDHVGVNVASMGNSFLRYLLPLSVVAAVSVGYVFERLWKNWSLKILAICIVVIIVGMGQWYAISKDDEGMIANARELSRYVEIRDAARSWLDPATVVLSDRSDKVFFPVFQSVSPVPNDVQLQDLIDDGYPTAIYLTTQDEKGLSDWSNRGFDLKPIFSNDNQTMYDVIKRGE